MSMRRQSIPGLYDTWARIPRLGPQLDRKPSPVRLRSQILPPRSIFESHSHDWHQLTYATEGVLNVVIESDCFVVAPGQALWIPKGTVHTTGSSLGAVLSSLYIDDSIDTPSDSKVFMVPNLLRALIIEVGCFDELTDIAYSNLVTELIIRQLDKLQPIQNAFPWPRGGVALEICEQLYNSPALDRSAESWATHFKMSKRTLARHFERETGLSMRVWVHKLRSLKALELLADGNNITQVALNLGYASTSSFTYMFKSEFGLSPSAYLKRP